MNDKKKLIIDELTRLEESASFEGAIPEIRLAEQIAYSRAIRIVNHHLDEKENKTEALHSI